VGTDSLVRCRGPELEDKESLSGDKHTERYILYLEDKGTTVQDQQKLRRI